MSGQELPHANRLGLDYRQEARQFTALPFPIWDVHTHLSGSRAVALFADVMDLYGIGRVYSMSPLEQLPALRSVLGERIRWIATPDFYAPNRQTALSSGYAERLRAFADQGARIAKFWSAPRGIDFAEQAGAPRNSFRLDTPHVQANMELAVDLGMVIMVHVADPDTWFATQYADVARYGTKADQYQGLRLCLERFPVPFIAAHLGGWPENLLFLDELLSSYERLYLDTSATKWMVRELSCQAAPLRRQFFHKWRHRLLFGSDIVTRDSHLSQDGMDAEDQKACDAHTAFDLYASRYWALRRLFETNDELDSPIADPDLHLVDPARFPLDAAPVLRGATLPGDVLQAVYHDTPRQLLEPLE